MRVLFFFLVYFQLSLFASTEYSFSGVALYDGAGFQTGESCHVDIQVTADGLGLESVKFNGYVKVFRNVQGVKVANSERVERREVLISTSFQGLEILTEKLDQSFVLEAKRNGYVLHKAVIGMDSEKHMVSAKIISHKTVFGSQSSEVIEGFCSFFNEKDSL